MIAGRDQCAHFPLAGVHTGGLGCQLILPDRQKRQAKARVFDKHAGQQAGHEQQCRDQRVEPLIVELQECQRMVAMHRQRHFLEAQVLQQVEDRQRIGEH